MSFLPDNYESPQSSGYYMKLQQGENKIRILSKPVIGWVDWENNTPIRYRMDKKPASSFDVKKPIKHFWAFIIWNYNDEQIQVLNITQATVMKGIEALSKDSEWGAPFHYDLKITKKGSDLKTEYIISPLPHKPIGDYVKSQFMERRCNLDALFDGTNPFDKSWDEFTDGVFEKEEEANLDCIGKAEIGELKAILKDCSKEYVDSLKETLKKLTGSSKLEDIPTSYYDKILAAATKKKQEYSNLPF